LLSLLWFVLSVETQDLRHNTDTLAVATGTIHATIDTTVTVTVTAQDASGNGQGPQAIVAYPQPADQQIMKTCAQDYYSISGNCCPK
jgi:hypothetical protein